MTRSIVLSCAIALAATALPARAQDPAPVFRAGADAVTVEASVRRDRRAVVGLKASDFEVLDNGVRQEITDVSYEKLPIDVTVAPRRQRQRDRIGARRAAPRAQAAAVRSRRAGSPPPAHLQHAREAAGRFQRSGAGRRRGAGGADGGGSSAVFDSLAVALAAPATPGRRQLIVLFSDGQDSSSITDADTLLDVARRSTPTVAVVLASPSLQRPASLLRHTTRSVRRHGAADRHRHRRLRGDDRAGETTSPRPSAASSSSSAPPTCSTSRRAASIPRARTRSTCASSATKWKCGRGAATRGAEPQRAPPARSHPCASDLSLQHGDHEVHGETRRLSDRGRRPSADVVDRGRGRITSTIELTTCL